MNIYHSVGRSCLNHKTDVMVVQYLLNLFHFRLSVNGIFNSTTEKAIDEFQTIVMFNPIPSGRIYPKDSTIEKLASKNSQVHYVKSDSSVFITAPCIPVIKELSDQFFACCNKKTVITSGYRSPIKQANAMFDKIMISGRDKVIGQYRDKTLVTEILDKFKEVRDTFPTILNGTDQLKFAIEAKEGMTLVIENQVKNQKYISRHLYNKAFDARSRNLTSSEKGLFLEIAKRAGLKAINEGDPPHFHLEILG